MRNVAYAISGIVFILFSWYCLYWNSQYFKMQEEAFKASLFASAIGFCFFMLYWYSENNIKRKR